MKKLFAILLTVFVVLSIDSCSDAKNIDDNQPVFQSDTRSIVEYPEPTFEQVKSYLGKAGYDTTTLTEHDGYYLIDGDMAFETDRLAEAIAQVEPKMVVGDKNKLNIF